MGRIQIHTVFTKINKKSLCLRCTRLGGKTIAILELKLCNTQITFPDDFLFKGMQLNF